ncbi:MAG: ATP-binding protein, partial [Sulfitobacter sp.]
MNSVQAESSKALTPDRLRTHCDPSQFSFESTAQLADIDVTVGQHRALDSLRFGLEMRGDGYNVFALGPPGIGKSSATRQIVEELAAHGVAPPDWCYVYNFSEPHRPNAIRLPPGVGSRLRDDMDQLVEDLQIALPAAFEGEDYRARVEEVEQSLKERQQHMMEQVSEQARERKLSLVHTNAGFGFAPLKNLDEVLPHDEFVALPESERKKIESDIEAMQQAVQKSLRQIPQWAKEAREQIKAINREIAESAVAHFIEVLNTNFADIAELADYLKAVAADVIDNVDAFLPSQQQSPFGIPPQNNHNDALRRYQVNLLVDNAAQEHAPVVFEDLPSYLNLIGRTEYQSQMGTLITNFMLIKPGALHRANGGFLVLDARQILMQPLAWDSLKRALQSHEIRLDSLERSFSLISTVSLEPEHIPLEVKVVLVGDRRLYYLLAQYDPDFADLFKVMADFNDVTDRNSNANHEFAALFATLSRQHTLLPLTPGAVARMIEQTARIAEDAEKLSTHLGSITDLLREADHWAKDARCKMIEASHVQHAIDQLIY